MSSAEMAHAMAPWNGSALDCSAGGLALCLDRMGDDTAPAACVAFRGAPGLFPAGTYCVCEIWRFGPGCAEIDIGGLYQAGFYFVLTLVGGLWLFWWVRETRLRVWLYIAGQRQHGGAAQSWQAVRSLLLLQLSVASMCVWSSTYVLTLVVADPPVLGYSAMRALSKGAQGVWTGTLTGTTFTAASLSYEVIERGAVLSAPGPAARAPMSVVIVRTSMVFTLVVIMCVAVAAVKSLVIAENASLLLATTVTGTLYVKAQGEIRALISRHVKPGGGATTPKATSR